ncbi:MAG: PEP-CTERM sorting domain-containing protein [Terriglobales bacterium]
MRRVAALALVALVLPVAAWADGINFTNQGGTVSFSDMAGTEGLGTIGSTTISSQGSQLTSWNNNSGHLGGVNYSTGALMSGSVSGGGTFAAGGMFDIIGTGKWASGLTGLKCGKGCDLFTGSFDSTAIWTLVSQTKQSESFTLTGSVEGTLYTGRTVTGTTTQDITIDNKGQLDKGIGHIRAGGGSFPTPEPGTLGLLGTGLLAVAGMFYRKVSRR